MFPGSCFWMPALELVNKVSLDCNVTVSRMVDVGTTETNQRMGGQVPARSVRSVSCVAILVSVYQSVDSPTLEETLSR